MYSYLKNCPLNAILFISCIFSFVIIIVLWSPRIINEYVDRPHFAPHHAHYKQRLSRSICICCILERYSAHCNMCKADPSRSPLKAISHFICSQIVLRVLVICYPVFSAINYIQRSSCWQTLQQGLANCGLWSKMVVKRKLPGGLLSAKIIKHIWWLKCTAPK